MKSIFKEPIGKLDYSLITDINNPPLCSCGCGNKVERSKIYSNRWSLYLFNHHLYVNKKMCKCGCGQKVEKSYQKYILGHNLKRKKEFPLCKCGCGQKVLLFKS